MSLIQLTRQETLEHFLAALDRLPSKELNAGWDTTTITLPNEKTDVRFCVAGVAAHVEGIPIHFRDEHFELGELGFFAAEALVQEFGYAPVITGEIQKLNDAFKGTRAKRYVYMRRKIQELLRAEIKAKGVQRQGKLTEDGG